jgi:hypothetical protein
VRADNPPVLPPPDPNVQGTPVPLCEKPPADAEILRLLPRFGIGVPGISKVYRGEVQIVCERLRDELDPPRFYPLIGPARLHHCRWLCTVYYNAVLDLSYPLRLKIKQERIEFFVIDKDQFHLYTEAPLPMKE